jgi:hypothetical protein
MYKYVGYGGSTTTSASSTTGTTSSGSTATSTHTTGMGCSLAMGIVGWWPGEDSPDDIVGSANGVWAPGSTPFYEQGRIGQAMVFDGLSYIRAPFVQTGPLTIDLWALSNAASEATFDATFASGDVATAPFFQIDSDGSGNYRLYGDGTGFNLGAIGNVVWQHLAVTYDGSIFTAYLDGQPVGTSPPGRMASFATLKIGSNRITTNFFKGRIDEVHIWNRALTAQEVATLAAISGPSLCP